MTAKAKKAASELLDVLPLVMRSLQPKMRQTKQLSSPAHFGILFMISKGQHNMSTMAKLRGVSLPTMSNSVSLLVDEGLVQRTRSEQDRRQVVLQLTKKGETFLVVIRKQMEKHLQTHLSSLTEEQLTQLLAGFTALRAAFTTEDPRDE